MINKFVILSVAAIFAVSVSSCREENKVSDDVEDVVDDVEDSVE